DELTVALALQNLAQALLGEGRTWVAHAFGFLSTRLPQTASPARFSPEACRPKPRSGPHPGEGAPRAAVGRAARTMTWLLGFGCGLGSGKTEKTEENEWRDG